jgi:hypothetical protein
MNIGGREKNFQIDEAYLMLGKSRYYDQDLFPHSMPSTTFCTNIPTAVKFTKPKFGAKNKHAFG